MFSVWVLFKFFLIISSDICQLLPAITVLVYTLTSLVPRPPCFLFFGFVQYNTQKRKSAKNGEGLGTPITWMTSGGREVYYTERTKNEGGLGTRLYINSYHSLSRDDDDYHMGTLKLIGASLSEPHTIVVCGTTCIDRPTDWPTDHVRPIHDMLHVPTLPRCHAAMPLMWTVQCVVEIATRLRTPTMGKWKAETPTQWTARLERERDQRIFSYLCFIVSVAILGFHVCQFFSPVTSHKPLFTLSYISTTCAHCILDKTYGHVMHTGVHRPHPLT